MGNAEMSFELGIQRLASGPPVPGNCCLYAAQECIGESANRRNNHDRMGIERPLYNSGHVGDRASVFDGGTAKFHHCSSLNHCPLRQSSNCSASCELAGKL